MVHAGESGDHDGKDVILDQHDCHDQAQAGRQVAHGGCIGTAAFVENPQRIHVQETKYSIGNGDDNDGDKGIFLQIIGMQGAHHLAGGIEIGGEIIHAKECQGSQQTDLTGTMDQGMFLLFDWRSFEGEENDHDK